MLKQWLIAQFSVSEKIKLAFIAVLILAVMVLMLRDKPADQVPPVNVSVPAKPAPEVKHEVKIPKPIKAKTIKAYRAKVKKDLKLPEAVQNNAHLELIASNQVKPDEHSQTLSTLLNTETGETETYVRRDPLPWLASDMRGEAGIVLGLKNGEPAVRLEARQNVFQVKAVHFGVTGSVDQTLNGPAKPDWMIGVGGWYRW